VRKQLAMGVVWTASARLLANLIGVASTFLLARLLAPEDFGLVALATTALTVISSLTELSLAAALIQHPAPDRTHYDSAWTLNTLRALLIALVLGALSPLLAHFYNDERLAPIILVLCGSTVLSGMVNPKVWEFNRQLSFRQEFISSLAQKLSGFLIAAWIAYVYHSYWALVIGSAAAQMVGLVVSYLQAPFLPRISLQHTRSLFSFSGWLFLGTSINAFNYRADQLAIGAVLPRAALGQYSVGDNLAGLPVRESMTPLLTVLFPAFTRLQNEPERLKQAYLRAQGLVVALGLPIGVGFSLVAQPFVHFAMGPRWDQAAFVVQALGAVFALQTFSMPFGGLAMALGKTRTVFVRDIFNFALRVPLIIGGLLLGGLLGVVAARCISGTLGMFFEMHLAQRLIKISIFKQIEASWRSIAATLTMCCSVWALDAAGLAQPDVFHLALLVATGASTYFASMFALWTISGRPDGPEREALGLAAFLQKRGGDAAPVG
jgi:O-antigen/teichoic acid export membrane protein